jgi:LemA protein
MKNSVENAFSGMDVQLKKRYDLIPNLVSVVKQYMLHEKNLLIKVTELRSQAINGGINNEEKVALDNQISGTMKSIMISVESYPNLKSSESFMNLHRNLTEVEAQISAARRAYNATVNDFNNGVEMFPSCIIANCMNLKSKNFFEIPKFEQKNVNFDNSF